MTRKSRVIIAVTACVMLLGSQATWAAVEYVYTDLGTFGGGYSRAYDINNAGQVVGWAQSVTPGSYQTYDWHTGEWYLYEGSIEVQNAFLYDNGTMVDLGWSDEESRAFAINDAGRIVGSVGFERDGSERAFRSEYGPLDETVDESFFHPLLQQSLARGINGRNQIVGNTYMSYGFGAFYYQNNQMYDIGRMLGSPSWVRAINNGGLVVGDSYLGTNYGGAIHAVIYDTSTGQTTDLGTLPGAPTGLYGVSNAWDINDRGQVVGQSVADGAYNSHAFLYENGTMTDLGSLSGTESVAYGINENGEVVGRDRWDAFVYRNGQMYNLNDLADLPYGWRMAEAYEINDLGQIVGYSVADGYPTYEHAFLLTPLSLLGPSAMRYDDPTSLAGTFSPRVFPVPLAEPVPEPSLVGLLVLLGACVCGRRPRRCPSTQVRTALALQRRPTTG